MKLLGYAIIACLITLQIGCASKNAKPDINGAVADEATQLKPEDLTSYSDDKPKLPPMAVSAGANRAPVLLQLKNEKGRVEISSECFESTTKTFLDGQIRTKKIEAADFKAKFETVASDKKGVINQIAETFYKDGPTNLHDLAFPELGEKMEFSFTPDSQVLKAGNYPKNSVFYVPPLPLPTKPVRVGETWEQDSSWKTTPQDGFELRSKTLARFEGWKKCGESECVEIRIAGITSIPQKLEKAAGYGHKLTGLFLFEPKRGLVPWARFESDELVQGKEARVVVKSILRSILLQPQGYYKASHGELACPSETKEE